MVSLGAHGVKSKINIPDPLKKKPDNYTPASHETFLAKEILVVLDHKMGIMSVNGDAQEVLGPVLKYGHPLLIDHFIRKKDCKIVRDALQAALSKGETHNNISVQMKTTKGQHIPIVFSTYPLYFDPKTIQGSVFSFKGRKVNPPTENTAVATSSRNVLMEQKSLLEALPEGVFTVNTKWQIASFNRAAEKITGYTKQEVLGHYCWEIFRSDLCDRGCPLKDALETGEIGTEQDVRILRKEDGPLTILVNAGVLRDDQGLIVGAIETFRILTGNIKPSQNSKTFSDIIGQSKVIQRLFKTLPDIAASEANVFLTGESGTGKELFARAIHDNSSRAKHPFVAVNCSALAETLLESELFGHEKSAFTGATKTKPGRFELAKQGTLFLDEIGELKPSLQIKLLRVLEQREFERVGGTIPIQLEARIISATNKDLFRAMEDGSFRKDFYYRLRTVPMVIPPLRDRKEDIPLLVNYFIRVYNAIFKKNVRKVDTGVMDLLLSYHWPGNVRELERTIEHAFVFVKGPVILFDNLPQIDVFAKKTIQEPLSIKEISPDREKIVQALAQADGKKKNAAILLGISRTSLWRKMKILNLLG
ncbi:MAG: sigma 54-interacting transcriptional regulator [Proteobacteria bacterium]|nr:sigma 54-interacting transcriptional regulator [Pseudomonadota bacterium]